jgi:hypothetical protein
MNPFENLQKGRIYTVWENNCWAIMKHRSIDHFLRIKQKKSNNAFNVAANLHLIDYDIPKYIKRKVNHYFKIIKVLP